MVQYLDGLRGNRLQRLQRQYSISSSACIKCQSKQWVWLESKSTFSAMMAVKISILGEKEERTVPHASKEHRNAWSAPP